MEQKNEPYLIFHDTNFIACLPKYSDPSKANSLEDLEDNVPVHV